MDNIVTEVGEDSFRPEDVQTRGYQCNPLSTQTVQNSCGIDSVLEQFILKMTEHKEVQKVWGSEEWIVNRAYCGKKLILNKGFRCSMHYHKNKDETFYILKGKVLMEIDNKNK